VSFPPTEVCPDYPTDYTIVVCPGYRQTNLATSDGDEASACTEAGCTGSPGQEPGFTASRRDSAIITGRGPVDRRGASTRTAEFHGQRGVRRPCHAASSKTGTLTRSQIIAMGGGFAIESQTDREPSGITARTNLL